MQYCEIDEIDEIDEMDIVQEINIKFSKTMKYHVKYIRYYIIGQKI